MSIAKLKKVQNKLKRSKQTACLLISSAPERIYSRDSNYPYKQDSDFYYLTTTEAKNLTLFVSNKTNQATLFAPPKNPKLEVWIGQDESPRKIANRISANLVITDNPKKEIKNLIKGHEALYHQNVQGSAAWEITQEIMSLQSSERGNFPSSFFHLDEIIAGLRLIKSPDEVKQIKTAINITRESIEAIKPLIKPGTKEITIKASLEQEFKSRGGGLAFETIAASGKNAATLHYEKHSSTLKRGQYLLLDCGASYNYYCSDVTRCFPTSSNIDPVLEDIYDIVLEAQTAAIKKIKHGVKIMTVYGAACKVITEGLKEIALLRGNTSKLLKKKAYLPYFMHGIGHSLGLDTHDVGPHREAKSAKLEKGMVFTIEPGLYFAKPMKHVPACGFRLEEDILVTDSGCKVLTENISKEL